MVKRNSRERRDPADATETENINVFGPVKTPAHSKVMHDRKREKRKKKSKNRGQFRSKDSNRKRNTSTTSNGMRKHTPGMSRSGERIHGTSRSGERIHDTSERIRHRDSGLFFSPDNILSLFK